MAAEPDNQELLRRWKNGDNKAGSRLIGRLFPQVKRFFARKVSDREVIEELVQQTFHRCVRKRDDFEHRASIDSYIYGIARYVLFEHFRAKRRADRIVGIEDMPVEDLDESPFVAVEAREERKVLINALRRLSVDTQILVELYFFERIRGPEICEILGLSDSTFRSRIRGIRRDLERHIQEFAKSPELLESTQMTLTKWAAHIRNQLPQNDSDD